MNVSNGINKIKGMKNLLDICKKYEKIDDEFKTYIEGMLTDPLVTEISLLHANKKHDIGIAGFNEKSQIEYIWIFRNQRGKNLSGLCCNQYGVSRPTKEIIDNMMIDAKVSIEEPYILMGEKLWNIKYGFEVMSFGFLGTGISYNEYEYGKGTFKKLECIIPLSVKDINLLKLEDIVGENINKIGCNNKRVAIDIEEVRL